MSKVCPKCDTSRTGEFCSECSTKLIPKQRCKNCGEELWPIDKYCDKCGTKKGEERILENCNWCKTEIYPDHNYCPKCGKEREEAINTKPPSTWKKIKETIISFLAE